MNRLVTANDIAVRDGFLTVEEWIRNISAMLVQKRALRVKWDGRTVGGNPVQPLVDYGRVLAKCDVCRNPEYVSPKSPIFYCMRCGNNGSGIARPVQFPDDWERIEAALVARPIVEGFGRNWVEAVLQSKPKYPELPREWRPGITVDTLEKENADVL